MLTLKEHQEQYLQDKTKSQLVMHILLLKKEINRIKRKLECENIAEFQSLPRKEAIRIQRIRLYIQDALKTLESLGGSFEWSAQEKEATAFQQNIPFIQRIDFTIGGFHGGFNDYIARVEEDKVIIQFEPASILGSHSTDGTDEGKREVNRTEFLKTIETLYLGEWRSNYLANDYGLMVLDGLSWEVKIHYTNDVKKVEFGGINAFPYNFSDFYQLFVEES